MENPDNKDNPNNKDTNHNNHGTDINKLLTLSRLRLSQAKGQEMETHIANMQDFIKDMIDSPMTDDVLPMFHPTEISNVLRDDIVSETVDREALQSGAPAISQGYYIVPKVID